MLEPVVEVSESLARGFGVVQSSDDELSDSQVEGRPGIEEEAEKGEIIFMQRVTDRFSQQKSPKFMAHTGTKELCFCSY